MGVDQSRGYEKIEVEFEVLTELPDLTF